MTCYVVARAAIRDRAAYERYAAAFLPILLRHGGRLLVNEEEPEPVLGEWDGRKLVLLAFSDREAALTWASSPEYQEIARDRDDGADVIAVLAEAFAPS